MSNGASSKWVGKTGHGDAVRVKKTAGTAHAVVKSKGQMIMEMADRMWPHLSEMLTGVRNDKGLLVQPAHVRGMALNIAQDLMKQHEAK